MKTYEIISFKNRYDKLGIIQKLSFEAMVKHLKQMLLELKKHF